MSILRGAALARHVTAGLNAGHPAEAIAAPYTVDRCAAILCRAHYAPLARLLVIAALPKRTGKPPAVSTRRPNQLVPRTDVEAMAAELRVQAADGVEWWEAAARVSPTCSPSAFAARMRDHGFCDVVDLFAHTYSGAKRPKPTRAEKVEDALDLADAGLTLPEAAERLGKSVRSMRRMLTIEQRLRFRGARTSTRRTHCKSGHQLRDTQCPTCDAARLRAWRANRADA